MADTNSAIYDLHVAVGCCAEEAGADAFWKSLDGYQGFLGLDAGNR